MAVGLQEGSKSQKKLLGEAWGLMGKPVCHFSAPQAVLPLALTVILVSPTEVGSILPPGNLQRIEVHAALF